MWRMILFRDSLSGQGEVSLSQTGDPHNDKGFLLIAFGFSF